MRALASGCFLTLLSLFGSAAVAHAQNFTTAPCNGSDGGSDGGWFSGHQTRACELRRTTLPLTSGQLGVTGRNGAIEVVGEDRSDIALEVKVTAQGSNHEDAEALLHKIRILTASGDIRADGPSDSGGFFHHGWSAEFRLHVPRRVARAELRTSNGGIHVSDLDGQLSASSTNGGIDLARIHGDVKANTTNGGLHLDELAGAVRAETTNGGVHITLAGARWQGSELFAKSTNGGISLKVPDHFAAHLVAETTNGGISVGFPITIQGKIGNHLETDVNGGGPTVHLETTNGPVALNRV